MRPLSGDSWQAEIVGEACLMLGAGSTVMRQLAHRPVGLGVAEHSTTLDRPLERLRNTVTYVYAVLLGSAEERTAVVRAVNRAHGPVRSPGRYDATDRDAQLWVAATLARNGEEMYGRVFGPLPDRSEFLAWASTLGTVLQLPAPAWPASAPAFDAYWASMQPRLAPDPVVQEYAARLLDPRGKPVAVRLLLPLASLVTRGNLDPHTREVLALPWSTRDQRRYDAFWRVFPPVYRRIPRAVRTLPARLFLWDLRRRLRGRGSQHAP